MTKRKLLNIFMSYEMLNWCSMMHSCLEFVFIPKKNVLLSFLFGWWKMKIYLLIMRSPLVTSSVFMLLSYKCKVSIFNKSTNHFLPIYNIWDSRGGYWPLLVLNSHIPFYRLPIPTFSKNIFAVFLNPKPINKRYYSTTRNVLIAICCRNTESETYSTYHNI